MAGTRSVVKHSYVTGKDKGSARAQAHVRYIQFRAGKDKDEEPRGFFNGLRDDITGREVSQAVREQDPRSTVMHKLILSPGVAGADVKEYCREVMADLSSRKGLDLDWYAVRHDNTDNPHCHIVIMGKDANGHRVRLYKEDYQKIKEAGDRYLERNRLLEREEKQKDKEKEDGRSGVTRLFDALRAAAKEFSREFERAAGGDKKPETKYEQRRREKDEERQRELDALGDPVDLDAYLAKQEEKEEKEKERKERAWAAYCKPIEIELSDGERVTFDRASSLKSLRDLERACNEGGPQLRGSLSEEDKKRLGDWIKEKYRAEKWTEQKAEKLESIDVELDAETKHSWSRASSLEDLRTLEALNARGRVFLDDAEKKALANWIKDQELKQPIRIELEPGAEPVVYDREDSKESLRFLAREYQKGEQWARENLTDKDYQKVRTWIRDKDKPKEQEREPEKDRILVGKTAKGKDKYVTKNLDAEALRAARDELSKDPGANKDDVKTLDVWIEARQKEEGKTREKAAHKRTRKLTAREKRMERAMRLDRAERYNSYYREKALKEARLRESIAKLKTQKSALDKIAHRETIDGEYSAKFGAEHSPIAAGPRGAASGGLRPLGANQFMRLLQQAVSKQKLRQQQREETRQAGTAQRELEAKQERLAETDTEIKKAERGEETKQRFGNATKDDVLGQLNKQKSELEKELKRKKEDERKRDPNRQTGKGDDDYFFGPGGRS